MLLTLVVPAVFVIRSFFRIDHELVALNKEERGPVHVETRTFQGYGQLDYNKIGTGALALNSAIGDLPFPNISKEILLLGGNTRPDASLRNMTLCIGIKGCDTTSIVIPGQKLYLSYNDRHLHFSHTITPIWIKPYVNEQLETHLEIGVSLLSKLGEVLLDETRTYEMHPSLTREAVQSVKDSLLKEGVVTMQRGRWFPPDHLFEIYGGEGYKPLVNAERLQLEGSEESYFLYVKEGDFFVWKEGRWQPSTVTMPYPMAKLTNIFPHKMEWTLWDKTGLESIKVVHKRENVEGNTLRAEEVFTQIRQRTTSQISCYIDGKTRIFKKGDWLIRLPTGWRIVKNMQEVNKIIDFTMQGELFVFDGIDKRAGKSIFCGALFDKMRGQVLTVQIPFARERRDRSLLPTTKSRVATKEQTISDEQVIKKQQLKRAYQKSRKRIQPLDSYEVVDEK